MKPVIEAWVRNASAFASGRLIEEPITLPVSDEKIDSFLRDQIKVDPQDGGYYISDYTMMPFGLNLGENANLYDLNMLANYMKTMTSEEVNLVTQACKAFDLSEKPETPLELLNLCVQASEIPFFGYEFDGIENCRNDSPEEKYGRYCAQDLVNAAGYSWSGISKEDMAIAQLFLGLEETGLEYCFDYEAFGRDRAINKGITLTVDGFLDYVGVPIDLDYFSRDELKAMVGEAVSQCENVEKSFLDGLTEDALASKEQETVGFSEHSGREDVEL